MWGNVNDSRILHRSTFCQHAQFHGLFDPNKGVDGVFPYLLNDKGYPLICWIMTPFKKEGQHSILELLYNRKHKRGKLVVENSFGKIFKEIQKFDLHVTFLFDVCTCCLLHNLFRFENETYCQITLYHWIKGECIRWTTTKTTRSCWWNNELNASLGSKEI